MCTAARGLKEALPPRFLPSCLWVMLSCCFRTVDSAEPHTAANSCFYVLCCHVSALINKLSHYTLSAGGCEGQGEGCCVPTNVETKPTLMTRTVMVMQSSAMKLLTLRLQQCSKNF